MKNLKYIAIFLSVAITYLSESKNTNDAMFISESVSVTWGRGYNCSGRGLCSMAFSSFDQSNAQINLLETSSRLANIEIPKSKNNSNILAVQFSESTFTLDRKFELRSAELETVIEIMPGTYLVEEDSDLFRLIPKSTK